MISIGQLSGFSSEKRRQRLWQIHAPAWRCSCSRPDQLPNRHMIRAACTWLLIVLAASPFTAPFSTCDASALFANRAPSVIAPSVLPCAHIATRSETDDAGSISPVVGRVVLSRDVVLVLTDWPVPPTSDALERSPSASIHYGSALADAPVQSIALRL
jgi:hypothetical protein